MNRRQLLVGMGLLPVLKHLRIPAIAAAIKPKWLKVNWWLTDQQIVVAGNYESPEMHELAEAAGRAMAEHIDKQIIESMGWNK